MIAPKVSNEAASGLKETCSVGFPPVPADLNCSGQASRIRGCHMNYLNCAKEEVS